MLFPLSRWAAGLATATLLSAIAQAADIVPSDVAPSTDDTTVLTLLHDGNRSELSRAQLERLPLYDTELQHFEGLNGRFTGIRLTRFIEAYGIDEARRLRFIAADDYTVFLTPSDVRAKDYLLVTRFEGEPLPRTNLGPLMLVVPEDAEAVRSGSTSMTNWIWAVVELRAQ
ncbi:MAG: molybdopterin-dependent oxidoreductase [Halofilum sp. (in: g-proteobacteria)]